jgi:PAS domain S-box-containing protein
MTRKMKDDGTSKLKKLTKARPKSKKEMSENPKSKIQGPKSKIQNMGSKSDNPQSEIRNRKSDLRDQMAFRKEAEEILKSRKGVPDRISEMDFPELLHEFMVYQAELEIQNEELRTAQHQLEESRRKYVDLFDFAPLGYFSFDRHGKILEVNLTGAQMLGIERRRLVKQLFPFHVSEDQKGAFFSHLKEVFNTGMKQVCELELMKKDGSEFYARLESVAVSDNAGNYSCRTAISDITQIKEAENKIRRYASFPNLNPNPILEADSGGKITFSNHAAMSIQQELDMKDTSFFLPKDLADILNVLGQGKGTSFYREVKIKGRVFAETIQPLPQFDSLRIFAIDITEKKTNEKALKASEKYFRLLMENSSDVVSILEKDGTIRYESFSVERMLGYRAEEIVGTNVFDLIHPDDLSDLRTIFFYGAKKPGIILSAQFRCRHKDGTWRVLDAVGKNLLDDSVIHGIVVNSRDITGRVHAEEAVRSERQRLVNILDSMVDGVYIVNQQNEIEYVNPLLKGEYGPVNGRKCHEYFEGRKKACTWCKNQEVFAGRTVRSEWYSEKTNRTYDLINTPLKNPDGSISKLGIFRDITERKSAEEALRESEEKFKTVFDGSMDGILVAEEGNRKFLMGNKAICSMLGYSEDEIKNLSINDIHPPEDLSYVTKEFERTARKETFLNENIPVKRKDGSVFYVDISASHITLSGKKYVVGSFRDITERKQAEESLKKGNRTLRALSNSDRAMLRAVSEEKFLKDICEIVVEDCGHAMVWIGFAEEDEGKTVRPVASAGFEEGYLETLSITWADTERGRGPTGTAIRTGRPIICRDMLADPAFEPWREEAIKRGYASSIVLPLMNYGKAFGAINIYSREPDPFTEDEVNLLSELSGDLSYGILAMRTRTAHAEAEESLRNSEAKYRSLFQNMTNGFAYHKIILDDTGKPRDYVFLEINDAFENLTGLLREDIIGKKVTEVIPGIENDPVDWIGIYGKVALSREPIHLENYSAALNNWYSVYAYSPAQEYFAVTFENVTDRKQTANLSDGLNRINEIISSSTNQEEIMQAVVREAAKVIGCESAAISLREDDHWKVSNVFGFSQKLIGTTMVNEEEPHAVLALKTKEPVVINDAYNDERVNREHMKKYGVRSVLVVPLFIANQPFGVIFFNYHSLSLTFTTLHIDFAAKLAASVSLSIEKARLMNLLKTRAAELESVNKDLENFSYAVSHDLKRPLRSIQGFAEAIIDDYKGKLDDEGRDFLHRITSAAGRMTQLVDALLDISRLTKWELVSKSVDLSSIAEVIAYELKKNEPGRKVEFVIAKGLKAQGDMDMLEIALRNLIDNAWKFTSRHASAKIEFGAITNFGFNSEIRIPQSEMEGKTVYFVRDDGAGFNVEFAGKLFMPFGRLHSDSEFPGLGIGLATVQKIVNKHGGKIWAESEPEKGATFYFTLG